MEEGLKLTTTEDIQNLIYTVRGKQVMIDSDVANLYHYKTKRINEAVSRNIERFPKDFCFQLTENEMENGTVLFSIFLLYRKHYETLKFRNTKLK